MNPRLIARLCPWGALALVVACVLQYFAEEKHDSGFVGAEVGLLFMAALLLWAAKNINARSKD